MQIKTKMLCNLTPIRMATIRKGRERGKERKREKKENRKKGGK